MSDNWRIAILRAVAWLLSIRVVDGDSEDDPPRWVKKSLCRVCRGWTPMQPDRSCGYCGIGWGPDYHHYPNAPEVWGWDCEPQPINEHLNQYHALQT